MGFAQGHFLGHALGQALPRENRALSPCGRGVGGQCFAGRGGLCGVGGRDWCKNLCKSGLVLISGL